MNLHLWEFFEPLVKALRPLPRREVPEARRPQRPSPQDATLPLPFSPPRTQTKRVNTNRSQPRQIAAPTRRTTTVSPKIESDSMQAKYDAVVSLMLQTHQVRVRKWRTSMSGIAWYVTYRDGRIQRLIEAPRPKGPMSVAVFLHEIGHHAIGFNVYKPRCLEEYHAWRWALEAMAEHGLNITDQVKLRVHRSLWYAAEKAKRRGIKRIPEELTPYLEKPSFKRRRRQAPR